MQLIYGEQVDLESMTLKEIHDLERKTGVAFIFEGCRPVAIRVPCDMPGMVTFLELK
ncbi:hypothetical protein [Hominifimenecus sp. rT4P-3]|uniref:hypothetical protein n=1 Tax=Hominifimenecus sp. rT4P-3 TaxID=3242979 RepID=UPI003DA6371E